MLTLFFQIVSVCMNTQKVSEFLVRVSLYFGML